MPRTTQKHDHQSAAYIVVSNKQDLSHVQPLSNALRGAADKTIVRATTTQDQQIIYFRHPPKMLSYLRDKKNRTEIEANRTQMRGVLADIAASVEKKLVKGSARQAREAVASLNAIAATRHGDVTVLDIRQPLDTIDVQLARLQRLQVVKATHQSPPETKNASMNNMLRRFDRMDEAQKKNLKKMLFPQSDGIALLKQEVILREMQILVTMLMKNPSAQPSEIAEKFCDRQNLGLFVNAWLAVRPDGKNGAKVGVSAHHQFAWRRGMDTICSALKKSAFASEGGTASGKSPPASLVDTPPLSSVGRARFKPDQKISAHQTARQDKPLASGSDETALEALFEKIKTPDLVAKTKSGAQHTGRADLRRNGPGPGLSPQNSFSGSTDADSPSGPSRPRLLRRTESGVLEEQILTFRAAEASAKAQADAAYSRLQALLHSRVAGTVNAIPQHISQSASVQVSSENAQRSQSLAFKDVRQRIMSVKMGEPATVTNLGADAMGAEEASFEQGSGLGARDTASLNYLLDGLNRPSQAAKRSASVTPITFDSVAQALPVDASWSLSDDDGRSESPDPSPVVLYTQETTQTQGE